MADIESHWAAQGISERLRLERFGAAPRKLESGEASEVRCARSERIFTTEAGDALLPVPERAGLNPAYGPRIGVWRTCLRSEERPVGKACGSPCKSRCTPGH